jgi:hypothetical protein
MNVLLIKKSHDLNKTLRIHARDDMTAEQSYWSSTFSAFSTIYISPFYPHVRPVKPIPDEPSSKSSSTPSSAPPAPTLNTSKRSSAHNNITSRLDYRLSLDEERGTSHLLGLVETHDLKDSRSDVTKDTVGLLQREALGGVGHDEGDLIQGVRSLGGLCLVEHLLSVTASVLVKCSVSRSLDILTRGRR